MVLPSDAPNSPSNAIIEWREDNGCDAWALFIPDAAESQSELAVIEGSIQRLKKQVSFKLQCINKAYSNKLVGDRKREILSSMTLTFRYI
jgi:hypothetical protein